MITFWLIAAVFVAIALAFLLPPLLQRAAVQTDGEDSGDRETNVAVYRDQLHELAADLQTGIISTEQFQYDRDEIERRLLADVSPPVQATPRVPQPVSNGKGTVYALALGIPIVAIGLYYQVGAPGVLSTPPATSTPVFGLNAASRLSNGQPPQLASTTTDGPMTQQRMEANIAALSKRLEQNPGDVEGWKMLARSYATQEKYAEASDAYARATTLKADDADLWADYALARTMANGSQVAGEPLKLVNKALALDPQNSKALQLAGGAAFQAKQYSEAVTFWERALKHLPPESELGPALKVRIEEAKSLPSK